MTFMSTFGEKVLSFHEELASVSIDLPKNYRILNPYSGKNRELVNEVNTIFYKKFFGDIRPRRLVLGSSPARRGTSVTGVPFEDTDHLYSETGIRINDFFINHSSSNFLYEVIKEYGGIKNFYGDFYLGFVCPLGLIRMNEKGNEVNCNYYESKKILNLLENFIITSLRTQISFGVDNSVCFCIGSGDNFKILRQINNKHNFFGTIVPLEHPRFITQYNYQKKGFYLKKYLSAFRKKQY